MKKIFKLTVLFVIISLNSFSQQQAQFSMYRFNPLVYNAAYAGSKDGLSITALGRKQWVGLNGSPTTGTISIHSPFKNEHLSAGISASFDKIGSTKNTGVFGDLAYRFKVNTKTRLSFGLKGGFDIFSINYSTLDVLDPDDIIFTTPIKNELLPNFGFGIYLDNRKYFIGITSPKLIQTVVESPILVNNGLKTKRHLHVMGGYVFKIKSYFDLIPIVNVKTAPNSPISLDLNLNALFYEKFWAGIGYRVGDALVASLMYDFTEKVKVGYAYDFTLSKLSSYNNGSHEIMVSYDLDYFNTGIRTPRKF